MRLLLPPSEAKATGGRGNALARAGYGGGRLGERRQHLCGLVEAVAAGSASAAIAAFLLPPAAAADALAANRAVSTAGTRRALERYAGIVYDGLAAVDFTPAQRRVAHRSILIFSGLFGVVGAAERVPDYRVPAAAVLPGVGTLASYWRDVLADELPGRLGRTGIVIDLRSTDYSAMWRPERDLARRVVTVRMLSRKPDGTLGVISYNSKLAKGRLARAIIERVAAGERVSTPTDVADAWVELTRTTGGSADIVDVAGRVRLDLITP